MSSTVLYLGTPGAGKSTLMRAHVEALARQVDAPFFFIVDHDETWSGPVYNIAKAWWRVPSRVAVFRGVKGQDVAQLAIDVGWAVYVDDEVDHSLDDWKKNPLREIVKRGRHLKNRGGQITHVSAMLATHRPSNLPTDVIGCFRRVYVGRLQGFADADRVYREGWIGAPSALEARQALETRNVGEFTAWP